MSDRNIVVTTNQEKSAEVIVVRKLLIMSNK